MGISPFCSPFIRFYPETYHPGMLLYSWLVKATSTPYILYNNKQYRKYHMIRDLKTVKQKVIAKQSPYSSVDYQARRCPKVEEN